MTLAVSGATSVDRNNNVKDPSNSKRRRRAGTKEQADKERMNEGIVKVSDYFSLFCVSIFLSHRERS